MTTEERAHYTHGHAEPVLRSHKWRTAENSAAYLLPHLSDQDRLLDVGCGPGTITADLAGRVARVTALEPAGGALLQAGEACAAAGRLNVDFVEATLQSAALADASYDVVHAHQVLQHVADPVGLLREMGRVCRPGGIVAARDSDYSAFTWYPEHPGLDDWLALYRAVARANAGEPDAGRRLLSWAREAGLDVVSAGAGVWCFSTPEDRAWWGGMWADRILSSAMADQAVADGHATRTELEAISRAWQEWVAQPDGWFMVPHGELVARAPGRA